jgi:hypothetical protein
MALELPRDPGAAPIPALAPDDTTVAQVSIAAGNNSAALPAGSIIVEVSAQDYCRMAFGISTVDATVGVRRLVPPGISVYKLPANATHFAVTQVGASTGVFTVTKLI